ncbi:MAG: cysteine-rich small domain-containing protein [Clostridiales bacterium]|nr:cysteine-rich small domain-containing protein [Clostridiales bacterium]
MSENYKFFQNRECEFFPCHKNVNDDEFNCLFCYCPLYMLRDECGGDFKMTSGVKDCSDCTKPHDSGSYAYIMSAMKKVIERGSDF